MSMDERLKDKVAVVTGAASGMGEAMATLFLRHGASVVLADRDFSRLADVSSALSSQGLDDHRIQRTDVLLEDDVREAVALAVSQFGRLDVMCNNAGVAPDLPILEMTMEEWDFVTGVNQRGVWFGIKHAARAMIPTGGGSIINTASFSGGFPRAGHAAYGSAKAGTLHLTRIAAVELGAHNIRCNAISPGCIATPMNYADPRFPIGRPVIEKVFEKMQPVPRSGQVDDVAATALFLASDDSSFISGQTIGVDGGGIMYDNGTLEELISGAKRELGID
jgi:NAD(P)-dependent dehydrogenase (short-subunit alcohol dehydrogenase family)